MPPGHGSSDGRYLATWRTSAARFQSPIAGVVAFIALALVSHLTPSVQYNDVLQADAWLHGHIDVDRVGPWIDAIPWRGGWYVVEAPLPALLMVPFVAIFGPHANQTLLSVILGAVAVGAAWELCCRLGTSVRSRVALVAFLALGTDLFWCAMLGDVWFVAHVSAVCFTLLAFVELAGKRRGWLVALYAAAAGLSRYPLLPALAVYPFLLDAPKRRRELMAYAATLVPIFAVWAWYNEARWGTPIDIGFTLFHQLYFLRANPTADASMLAVDNVQGQLWSFFAHPPLYFNRAPWVGADRLGLALTYTSPALVCAFLARRPIGWVVTCWLLAAVAFVPSLLYFDAGGEQFGMRHALDFEPFLFVLMVLGVGRRLPWWAGVLIAWSVGVGIWGLWYWRAYPNGP